MWTGAADGQGGDFSNEPVLWDPQRQVTITHALLQDGCGHSPYEGLTVTGWPARTILRGHTLMHEGRGSEARIGSELKR